jgi:hypothetical protein
MAIRGVRVAPVAMAALAGWLTMATGVSANDLSTSAVIRFSGVVSACIVNASAVLEGAATGSGCASYVEAAAITVLADADGTGKHPAGDPTSLDEAAAAPGLPGGARRLVRLTVIPR